MRGESNTVIALSYSGGCDAWANALLLCDSSRSQRRPSKTYRNCRKLVHNVARVQSKWRNLLGRPTCPTRPKSRPLPFRRARSQKVYKLHCVTLRPPVWTANFPGAQHILHFSYGWDLIKTSLILLLALLLIKSIQPSWLANISPLHTWRRCLPSFTLHSVLAVTTHRCTFFFFFWLSRLFVLAILSIIARPAIWRRTSFRAQVCREDEPGIYGWIMADAVPIKSDRTKIESSVYLPNPLHRSFAKWLIGCRPDRAAAIIQNRWRIKIHTFDFKELRNNTNISNDSCADTTWSASGVLIKRVY